MVTTRPESVTLKQGVPLASILEDLPLESAIAVATSSKSLRSMASSTFPVWMMKYVPMVHLAAVPSVKMMLESVDGIFAAPDREGVLFNSGYPSPYPCSKCVTYPSKVEFGGSLSFR